MDGRDGPSEELVTELEDSPYSMTEEKLRSRLNIVNKGTYLPQLFCALTGSVCFGIVLGWSCPVIRQQLDKGQDNTDFLTVAGLAPLGACMGCALFHVLSESRGPRTVVLMICPIQVICWILIAYIKNEILYKWMIFCSGFLSIGFMHCGETLIWDSVHAGYSNQFMILFDSSVLLGVLVSYSIGFKVSSPTYFSIAGAICVSITFVMYYFIPESPVFLFGKNPVTAEKALTFLRGEMNIYDDMRLIKKDYELRTIDIAAKYMFFKHVVYKPTLVIIGVTFFRVFTGYFTLIAFGLTVIEKGDKNITFKQDLLGKFEDGVLLATCLYISRVLSCAVLQNSFGVRKPLIISSIMVTIFLFSLTIFFYLDDAIFIERVIRIEYAHIKLVLYCLYVFSYDMGYNSIPSIVATQYLPLQVYPWVKLLTQTLKWLFAFILVMITVKIGIDKTGSWHNFTFLSCTSFIGIIFHCVFLVESKGKTLVELQHKFGGNPVGSRSSRQTKRMTLTGQL